MSKLQFTRDRDGAFNFSESTLARVNAELRERSGQQGALLPQSLMESASAELIRTAHKLADARGCSFLEAAGRAVRQRPELFAFTRGLATHDHDAAADVAIT